MNRLTDRIAARIAAGSFSCFRRIPLRLQPDDFRNMRISFSQFGEDLIIAEHLTNFKRERRGIYIDAGCFDPFRFSNTRLLNLLGWHGINVDASEEAIRKFHVHRPHDQNVCAALSDRVEAREFLMCKSSAMNRLISGDSPSDKQAGGYHKVEVRTQTLMGIFEQSQFSGEGVDLLSIDCEGSDLAVLRGFDLGRTRPVLICIESLNEGESKRIRSYLEGHGYSHLCNLGLSLLFRDSATLP